MAIIIHELQDLTYLKWNKTRNSSGTAGSFLKSQEIVDGKKRYYKLSNYDAMRGIVGHECVNEVIADRILTLLGIWHVEYTLSHAKIMLEGSEYITYLCSSEDFKMPGESKIAFDVFYQVNAKECETPMEFCVRMGWEQNVYDMLLIDYLVLNRDRHGANIEVLRNSKSKSMRLAPLYDHGLSLLFSATDQESVLNYDVHARRSVQCFVGSNYTVDNLQLIPCDLRRKIPTWSKDIETYLFDGMEQIVGTELMDKMMEMIRYRWEYYESFCN